MRSCCGRWGWRGDSRVTIESLVHDYGLLAIFLGAGFEGEAAVVAGGVLAHTGLVGLPGAMAAASLGSCLADQLFFIIGRYYRDSRVARWAHGKPVFARALAWVEHYPIGFIFAFRFIYGFRTISPFAIGTTRVAGRLFVVVNIVAAIVWGCAFTAIGYFFGREFEALLARWQPSGRTLVMIGAAVVGAAVLAVVARRAWRR